MWSARHDSAPDLVGPQAMIRGGAAGLGVLRHTSVALRRESRNPLSVLVFGGAAEGGAELAEEVGEGVLVHAGNFRADGEQEGEASNNNR